MSCGPAMGRDGTSSDRLLTRPFAAGLLPRADPEGLRIAAVIHATAATLDGEAALALAGV